MGAMLQCQIPSAPTSKSRKVTSLRELPTDPHFNTSTDEVARQFLIPALSKSVRYDRGVGFFSSPWLRMVATGLVELARNDGVARIVASPKLSAQDWAALRQGSDAQTDLILRASLARSLDELRVDLERDTLAALAWMVADGLLEFRVAIPTGELDGDFHDKFGQFHDSEGNTVAFSGSPNDSERAFRNYESISCFYSWLDEREQQRVQLAVERFTRVWENNDANVRVYPLPDAIRRNLVQFTDITPRPYEKKDTRRNADTKWRHQQEALAAFLAARNGILAMATGTGKTRTALAILRELTERGAISSAIVTMSGTDLLDQWRRELLVHSPLIPVYCAFENFKEQLQYVLNPRHALLLISRQSLSAALQHLPLPVIEDSLIVCDEVHGFGSEGLTQALSGKISRFKYRLGLSATPEREYDPVGDQFIKDEIGPIIFEFGLRDAIKRGILCEFDYVSVDYSLSLEDRRAIRDVIRSHHARIRAGEPASPEEMFRRIAAVRKTTITKLPPFERFLRSRPNVLQRCLIFVDNREYGLRVQELVLAVTGNYHTYFAEDARETLRAFSEGSIDCLITCHRISEGIDIRSVSNIVLFASARTKLETIQRLGRCLRTDDANPLKRALVVDFVEATDDDAPNSPDDDQTADEERREWFEDLSATRRMPS